MNARKPVKVTWTMGHFNEKLTSGRKTGARQRPFANGVNAQDQPVMSLIE
jgi:hypothetical protein